MFDFSTISLKPSQVLAVAGSVDVEAVLGQNLLDSLATGVATCAGQFVVELLGAVGRSVTVDIEALSDAVVLLVGSDVLLELGDTLVLLERLLVHHRAVDLVENVGFVDLVRRALVAVGCRRSGVAEVEVALHGVDALGDENAALRTRAMGLSRLRVGQHGGLLLRHGLAVAALYITNWLASLHLLSISTRSSLCCMRSS